MKEKNGTRIGVVVAIEIDAVLERYGEALEDISLYGHHVRVYRCGEAELYILESGAGEIAAAAGTEFLISRFDVDMIVNFGVVGGLSEDMKVTKLCVVDKVIHYDFDTTGWLNLERGQYPDQSERYPAATESLVDAAVSVLPELRRVICASADKFIDPPEQKAELHRLYGADICDMEAAGIVLTCRRSGVPCLLIKAVSDGLTGGGAEFLTELHRVSKISFDALEKIIAAMYGAK